MAPDIGPIYSYSGSVYCPTILFVCQVQLSMAVFGKHSGVAKSVNTCHYCSYVCINKLKIDV